MKTWLKKIFKRFEEYQQKRADYMLLRMLSDKELHDIGIARGQIREVIYGDYEGRAPITER